MNPSKLPMSDFATLQAWQCLKSFEFLQELIGFWNSCSVEQREVLMAMFLLHSKFVSTGHVNLGRIYLSVASMANVNLPLPALAPAVTPDVTTNGD